MNEVTKQQDLKQDYREEMKQTILSIAGRPGLYKLVSRGNNSLIVETLDETHTRRPAFATDRVTSLSDIAMYTDEEDIPLGTVLASVRDKEEGKPCSLNWRKASANELQTYFGEVLPNFDRDRVHNSDIKKLLQWYDILVKAGITDFEPETEEAEGETAEDAATEE